MAAKTKLSNQRVMTMTTRSHTAVALLTIGAAALWGCGGDNPVETHYYTGSVFDGVYGTQLGVPGKSASFDIAVDYFGRYEKGTIDGRGNFQLPPIPAYHDFTVYIDSMGYRSFVAHEEQWIDAYHADRSYFYVAYLFKTDLVVLDVPVTVTLDDSAQQPNAGEIRLRPTDLSNVYDSAAEQPAAVTETSPSNPPITIPQHGAQIWENDNDLLAKTAVATITNGQATVLGSDLLYGVPYQVVVMNVPGYQYTEKATFTAGTDSRLAITLTKLALPALQVVYVSTNADVLSPDGTVTIVFNEPIEFDPRYQVQDMKNSVDGAFTIVSVDTNLDGTTNTLNPDDGNPATQEHGTTITISGNAIILTWDRTRGLRTVDPADRITSLMYGGLNGVHIRPVGTTLASEGKTLGGLVGSNSITVQLTP